MYEECKYYLEYMEVRKKIFIFACEKCEKVAISLQYHESKFLDLFNFCEKDLNTKRIFF